jgi:hypothetical protein
LLLAGVILLHSWCLELGQLYLSMFTAAPG